MRQILSFTQCLLWRISFLSVGATLFSNTAVLAQAKPNSIGPTVTFGNGSSTFGVGGKFRLTENVFEVKNAVSLRPFVRFPAEGVDVGAGVTYDFDFPRYAQVTPYAGIGLGALNGTTTTTNQKVNEVTFYGQAGVEINASPDLSLSGNLQVPFNNKFGTNFTFGANYRF
jgi:opacity protein-like surface antigen